MIRRTVRVVLVTIVLPLAVATPANAATELTLESIFGEEPLVGPAPTSLGWRPGHETVVWVDGESTMVELEPSTGSRRDLVTADALQSAFDGSSLPTLGDAVFSSSGNELLVRVGDELWLMSLADDTARRIDRGDGREEAPVFSPQGRRLAFVRDHDLYVVELDTNTELRVTDDGSDTVLNGLYDWVYGEELAGRQEGAFAWSDDGSVLAWLRLDDGPVPPFHLVDLAGVHSTLRTQPYPMAGDPIPRPSAHAVRFGGDGVIRRRIDAALPDPQGYIPRVGCLPSGEGLWFERLDRAQKELRLEAVRFGAGQPTSLVTDTDSHWIEAVGRPQFLTDGSFLWLSRRSGWRHLERVMADGSRVDLTPGEFDVTHLLATDSSGIFAWYRAARPDPRQRHLFRVEIASGDTQRVSSGGGTWKATLSPERGFLLAEMSDSVTPPRDLVLPATGGFARDLGLRDRSRLDGVDIAAPQPVSLTASDGTPLDGWLLVPPDRTPDDSFPVVVYTYGGPHGTVVADEWSTWTLLHRYLVQEGFCVFALDNRGSAARGAAFESAIDGRLGSSQLGDQLAGLRWLRSQPFVDPDRIGMWGWSYGGYLTAYALTHVPTQLAAGVAVAPVTDWKLYDAIYTERYMGTPTDNPDGYAAGSVLEAAGNLARPLLVVHGTLDGNVHLQNTLQLADRVWRTGGSVDLMLVPGADHSIRIDGARLAVARRLVDHFRRHLQSPCATRPSVSSEDAIGREPAQAPPPPSPADTDLEADDTAADSGR
jgi:dipeptidyl-peptidase-4